MKKFLISFCSALAVLFICTGSPVHAKADIKRIDAGDRYEFSVEASKMAYEKAEAAVLVNGRKNADMALTTTLSRLVKGPVFLTNGKDLSQSLKAELQRLGVKKLYLIGGDLCISKEIEKELTNNYEVTRYGGKDRYETSLKLAKSIKNVERYFLADAYDENNQLMSARAVQLYGPSPIVYVNKSGGPEKVKEALDKEGSRLETLLPIRETFKTWNKKPGANRYKDRGPKDILNWTLDIEKYSDIGAVEAILINGRSFSDVICGLNMDDTDDEVKEGSMLFTDYDLRSKGRPIYFTEGNKLSKKVLDRLNRDYIKTVYLMGGNKSIRFSNIKLKPIETKLKDTLKEIKSEGCIQMRVTKTNPFDPFYLVKDDVIKKAFSIPDVGLIKSRVVEVLPNTDGNIRMSWDFSIRYPLREKDKCIFLGIDYKEGYLQVSRNDRKPAYITYKINPEDIGKLKAFTEELDKSLVKKPLQEEPSSIVN